MINLFYIKEKSQTVSDPNLIPREHKHLEQSLPDKGQRSVMADFGL